MRVIYSNDNQIIPDKTCIGLGNFDGVHIGHAEIIKTVVRLAGEKTLASMVYTFDQHPQKVLAEEFFILSPNKVKLDIIGGFNPDYLYVQNNSKQFLSMQPEDFIESVLVGGLNAKAVVVGFNYRFGRNGAGDIDLLKQAGKNYGFELFVVAPVIEQGHTVSSTSVRKLISEGDLIQAEKLLGRRYSVCAEVVHGKQLGKRISFPTINFIPKGFVLPPLGVYFSYTIIGKRRYASISNVGVNPTVNGGNTYIGMETHILDFAGDLYGNMVLVEFVRKLRDEKKFDSVEQLVEQINDDVIKAKCFFGGVSNLLFCR